jgi:uncharacterized membrane protein
VTASHALTLLGILTGIEIRTLELITKRSNLSSYDEHSFVFFVFNVSTACVLHPCFVYEQQYE